jgi:hypothetical protein
MSLRVKIIVPLLLVSLACDRQNSSETSSLKIREKPVEVNSGPVLGSITGTTDVDLQVTTAVEMLLKIEKTSPISSIFMTFKGSHHDNYMDINLWNFNGPVADQDGRILLRTDLDSRMESDEYRLSSLSIVDEAKNSLKIEIERDDSLIPGTQFAVPKIRVRGGANTLGAFFRDVRLDRDEYQAGETIKVSFKLDEASSKLWLVMMSFAHESESQSWITDGGSPGSEEESFLNIPIPLDAKPGTYYLSTVSGTDEENKHSSLRALPESIHFFNSGIKVPRFTIR